MDEGIDTVNGVNHRREKDRKGKERKRREDKEWIRYI